MTAVLDDDALSRDALLRELEDAGAVYVRTLVGTGLWHYSEYVRAYKSELVELVRRHGPSVTYSVNRGANGSLYVG